MNLRRLRSQCGDFSVMLSFITFGLLCSYIVRIMTEKSEQGGRPLGAPWSGP